MLIECLIRNESSALSFEDFIRCSEADKGYGISFLPWEGILDI